MDQELKQRLIGASVIIALAIIFVPMLFDGDGVKQQNQNISIAIPEVPNDLEVKTFDIDKPVTDQQLNVPEGDLSLSQRDNVSASSKTEPQLISALEAEAEQVTPVVVTQPEKELVVETEEKNVAPAEEQNRVKVPKVVETIKDKKPVAREESPIKSIDLAFRVKMGSFSQQANAQKVKAQLLQKNIRSIVEKDTDRSLYHVWSEQMYQSKSKAEEYIRAVNALNLKIGTPKVQTMDANKVDQLAQAGQLGWVVQLGSFSAKANAIELRNKVKAAGFIAFVDRVKNSKGENRYRLRVGPLMEKRDAENAKNNINKRLKISGLIKTHDPGQPVES